MGGKVLRTAVNFALGCVAALLLLAAVLPSLGLGWRAELPQHARLHLLVLALPFLLAALWRRRWLSAGALALTAVLSGLPVAVAVSQMAPRAEPDEAGEPLRVMTFNLAWHNGNLEAMEAEILAADPDLLMLTEVAERHRPLVEGLAARYPEHRSGLTDRFFARLPLENMRRTRVEEFASLWVIDSQAGGRPLTVLAGHPYPPTGEPWDRVNEIWFAQARVALARVSAKHGEGAVVVLGDLNATPWSERLQSLLDYGGLRRAGGWLATWPTQLPPWAGIAIDQILVSEGIKVSGHFVTAGAGSDHRGLVVDLLLPPR